MSNVGLIVDENLASLSFMFHLSSLFNVFSMIGENKLIKIMYLKIPKTFPSKKSLLGQMGKFGSTIVQHQASLYLVIKITLVKFPKKILFWAEWEALCQLLSKIIQAYIPRSASTISTNHQTFRMSQ